MLDAPERQSVALAKPLFKYVSFQGVTCEGVDSAVPNLVPVVRCGVAVWSHANRRQFGSGSLRSRRRRQAPFSAGFGTVSAPIHFFPKQLPKFFAP